MPMIDHNDSFKAPKNIGNQSLPTAAQVQATAEVLGVEHGT